MSDPTVELFVNGTLMRGLELHGNLRDAAFAGEHATVPAYRLHAIAGAYPAMLRDAARGAAIRGELYTLTTGQLADVLDGEPAGLGLGVVELDGVGHRLGVTWVAGELPADAQDITHLGGWRAYLAQAGRREHEETTG